MQSSTIHGHDPYTQLPEIVLPPFCSSILSDVENVRILDAIESRAFNSLPEELTDIVVQHYIAFIHPQLPVLNLNEFLLPFETSCKNRKISPLLWQAITTAAIPFLTDCELGLAGLVTARSAVNKFASRTKVRTMIVIANFWFMV